MGLSTRIETTTDGVEMKRWLATNLARGNPIPRDASPEARLRRAELTHRELDGRLRELGKRLYLTPIEQREVAELKKLKLVAKDEIASLRSVG